MNHEPDTSYTGETFFDTSDQTHVVLDELFADLEFAETPGLIEARTAILMMLHGEEDSAKRRLAWIEYDRVGEELVDTTVDPQDIEKRAKMHIALIIYKACLFREAGQFERYAEELESAYTYARSRRFETVTSGIDAVLDELERQQRDR